MPTHTEALYDTKQEGPFYRVHPRAIAQSGARTYGLREEGGSGAQAQSGSSRDSVSQPSEDARVRELISSGNTRAHEAAHAYSQQMFGRPYAPIPNSPSSLKKQAPIGQMFMLATKNDPAYKQAVYEAYKRQMPEHVGDAKDYDELVNKAYRHLNHETQQQFDTLPVHMSFHRNGEGNYRSSNEMLRDIYKNGHLYVFQGGEPHLSMNNVDPRTGLNDTEMFRAVHDFYGHALHGNQFGPKGEEQAWAAHSGMYSPLAQAAMTTETRGQNSVVNYTPLNAHIKQQVRKLDESAYHAARRGDSAQAQRFLDLKKQLLDEGFTYGPQASILLPPEMTRGDYAGGIPAYLRHLIRPPNPASAELTHFSNEPNLTHTDPGRYGTGIKGAEAERLSDPSAIRNRTYFYAGSPERGEQGLGSHKYHTRASDLYDVASDPQGLHRLAIEHNITPYTAKYNQGVADPQGAFTDLERMAHEHGYGGVLQRNTGMPMAAVFGSLPVRKAT